ncbi:MAG: serine hydrolase [Firmicutes bacterium]|nr:serine hydrolase [Bacillota bacterium]
MNQEEKIKQFEKKIELDYSNTTGIVVLKNGESVYENYFNGCVRDSKVHVYSVSKSILSILIGIAIDKGLIKSLDQKVLDFFPDYQGKKKEDIVQQITLRDLITMTVPYKYKESPFIYIRYFMSKDFLKFTLNQLGGKKPIGEFRYTPLIGPDILSGVIAKATGMSVFDFAQENLFQPLGITVEKNIYFKSAKEQTEFNKKTNVSGWATDSQGLNTGGWGLTLSAWDMAKIGQLYLNQGIWNEKRIVSSEWMEESIKEHSKWKSENLSYGYLWWIINADEQACAAMGDGGNVIYFNHKKKLVVSIASLFEKNAKDRMELILNEIEPMFEEK